MWSGLPGLETGFDPMLICCKGLLGGDRILRPPTCRGTGGSFTLKPVTLRPEMAAATDGGAGLTCTGTGSGATVAESIELVRLLRKVLPDVPGTGDCCCGLSCCDGLAAAIASAPVTAPPCAAVTTLV